MQMVCRIETAVNTEARHDTFAISKRVVEYFNVSVRTKPFRHVVRIIRPVVDKLFLSIRESLPTFNYRMMFNSHFDLPIDFGLSQNVISWLHKISRSADPRMVHDADSRN